MTWRTALAAVGLSFAVGALADDMLRARLDRLSRPSTQRVATTAPDDVDQSSSRHDPAPASPAQAEAPDSPVATAGVIAESPIEALRRRALTLPVEGISRDDLRDTFAERRGGDTRAHEALDIMAARRTAVRAVENGVIEKLFTSKAGGLTVYQFEPTGTFCYYYAHLDAYADGLQEGQQVVKGQVIGYVGSTGNASPDAPHLHFAIFRLTPERQWWRGEPINPYPVLH
jgi:peptidoglycan LD-endopeptidase LytH